MNTAPPSNSYGVYLIDGGEGSTNHVDLASGAISENPVSFTSGGAETAYAQRVSVSTLGVPSGTLKVPGSMNPETVFVFPEGNLPLLGAGQSYADNGLLPTSRVFFRFGGNDQLGGNNMELIQGVFSTGTGTNPEGPGVGGPFLTANYCYFVYYPNSATVFLSNNANGWVNPSGSPVGHNGIDQTLNGICTIHGATSYIPTVPADCTSNCTWNDASVILDIQFLTSGTQTWYMYESVENNQGYENTNNVNGSTFPWSLWGYWQSVQGQ